MYLLIKHLHMTLAIISVSGFMVRGFLAINQHPVVKQKWIRVIPHVIDTLLLLAALFLAWSLHANPIHQPWLAAKIIALLLYIGLGVQVIKTKGSKARQWSCYFLAIGTFIYIGVVAVSKSPTAGLF